MRIPFRKPFSLAFALLGLSATAEAANIHAGNWEVGGQISLNTSSSGSGSSTGLSVNPSAEYFVQDSLSVGGRLSWSHLFSNDGISSLGVGPSATYYLPVGDHGVPYASLGLLYDHLTYGLSSGSLSYWTTLAAVGLDCFLTESVAVGPEVQWIHAFGQNGSGAINYYTESIAFRIFL